MTSLYNNLFKDIEKLLQSGSFDAAHEQIGRYRDDDADPSLNAARFLLYSREKGNPHYNPDRARVALDIASEGGDVWSIAKKGYFLLKGIMYERNVEEADDLFTSISEKSSFAKYHLALINTNEYGEDLRTKEALEEALGYLLELIEQKRCDPAIRELSKLKWVELMLESETLDSDQSVRIQTVLNALQNPNGDVARKLRSDFYIKMLSQQVEEAYAIERHPSGIAEKEKFGFNYQRALQALSQLKSCL